MRHGRRLLGGLLGYQCVKPQLSKMKIAQRRVLARRALWSSREDFLSPVKCGLRPLTRGGYFQPGAHFHDRILNLPASRNANLSPTDTPGQRRQPPFPTTRFSSATRELRARVLVSGSSDNVNGGSSPHTSSSIPDRTLLGPLSKFGRRARLAFGSSGGWRAADTGGMQEAFDAAEAYAVSSDEGSLRTPERRSPCHRDLRVAQDLHDWARADAEWGGDAGGATQLRRNVARSRR